MEIKMATTGDAHDLFELNTLFGNTTSADAMQKALARNGPEVVCIAYVDGIAAGYCTAFVLHSMCYNENRADIESLFVKKEYRRQGVAKALLSFLESTLCARGIRHFHISTSADNAGALSLYRQLGFAQTDELLLDKTI